MNDDNWELVNGPHAHHIEQLNAVNVINVIEAMITLFGAMPLPIGGIPSMPRSRTRLQGIASNSNNLFA